MGSSPWQAQASLAADGQRPLSGFRSSSPITLGLARWYNDGREPGHTQDFKSKLPSHHGTRLRLRGRGSGHGRTRALARDPARLHSAASKAGHGRAQPGRTHWRFQATGTSSGPDCCQDSCVTPGRCCRSQPGDLRLLSRLQGPARGPGVTHHAVSSSLAMPALPSRALPGG